VRVVREETNSYGDMVGELLGYGRNLCMGYLNKVSISLKIRRMADSCDCPIKGALLKESCDCLAKTHILTDLRDSLINDTDCKNY
jgi:hypothetical protein